MQYVRRYFGADVTDPHHYHLVINSGKVGYQEATKIIVEAVSRQCAEKGATLRVENNEGTVIL
jgi:cytidylate kinase